MKSNFRNDISYDARNNYAAGSYRGVGQPAKVGTKHVLHPERKELSKKGSFPLKNN